MTAGLRQDAGSLLVVGVGGIELTGLERAWLKLVRPAGIILFRRNIADHRQTHALLSEAKAFSAPNSLGCVDLEGGTVDRLRDALAPMPSAQAVATAARQSAKPRLAQEHGALIARAVSAFGFNITLAPVLDLAQPASAGVMGSRVTAPEAAGVIAYARSFLQGLQAHGVLGCGKHFPGLGAGTLDSHLETPSIGRTWSELWNNDLAPYRALRDELPMAMVNHAAYPATRSGDLPASVSKFWITTVLRRRIGFRGLIFSDDLEMGGILKFMPIEEAAVTAIGAGLDLVEICHSPELIFRAYEALLREGERSRVFRGLLAVRSRRTAKVLSRLLPAQTSAPLTAKQFEALRTRIGRFSETIRNSAIKETVTA